MPARWAASTFSFTPPIGSTGPVRVIYPVIATSSLSGRHELLVAVSWRLAREAEADAPHASIGHQAVMLPSTARATAMTSGRPIGPTAARCAHPAEGSPNGIPRPLSDRMRAYRNAPRRQSLRTRCRSVRPAAPLSPSRVKGRARGAQVPAVPEPPVPSGVTGRADDAVGRAHELLALPYSPCAPSVESGPLA
jgi:hypothetical protein